MSMQKPISVSIDQYDYPLPQDRIAQYPLVQRDKSKLLVFKESPKTATFKNISDPVQPVFKILIRGSFIFFIFPMSSNMPGKRVTIIDLRYRKEKVELKSVF